MLTNRKELPELGVAMRLFAAPFLPRLKVVGLLALTL